MRIIYPEVRDVAVKEIISWAQDAWMDCPEDPLPADLGDCMEFLEDQGLVTFHRDEWSIARLT